MQQFKDHLSRNSVFYIAGILSATIAIVSNVGLVYRLVDNLADKAYVEAYTTKLLKQHSLDYNMRLQRIEISLNKIYSVQLAVELDRLMVLKCRGKTPDFDPIIRRLSEDYYTNTKMRYIMPTCQELRAYGN